MLFSNDYNQLKLLNQNSSSVTYSSSFKIDDILNNNNKSEKINFSKILNENFNSKRIDDGLIKVVNNNCDKTVNQQDFNHQYLLNNSLYLNHHQVPSASTAIMNEKILHNLEKQHLKDQVCCSVPEEQNFKKSEKMRRKNEKKKCSVIFKFKKKNFFFFN
jgi:hypothetical protein